MKWALLIAGLVAVLCQDQNQGDVCNPDTTDLDNNDERCNGMACEANYQCFELNCNSDLKCANPETASRFNGILAIIFSAAALAVVLVLGIFKLYRNRLTSKILREKLAGAVRTDSKKQEADFTVRKKTVRSSRRGTTMFPGYEEFANKFSINLDRTQSNSSIGNSDQSFQVNESFGTDVADRLGLSSLR